MNRFFRSTSLVVFLAVLVSMAGTAFAQERDDRNRERDEHRYSNAQIEVRCSAGLGGALSRA
jgi:hypothetical protein